MSEIRRTRLVVPGMYCEGCAETIRDALGATAGVREVSVDVERRELTIAWGPEHTSEDAIRSRLAAAGFHARSSDDAAGEEPAPRALFGRVAALVLGLLAAGGVGYSCLAELRTVEALEGGAAKTPFLQYGDVVRIEMKDKAGHSIFGAIEQTVAPL